MGGDLLVGDGVSALGLSAAHGVARADDAALDVELVGLGVCQVFLSLFHARLLVERIPLKLDVFGVGADGGADQHLVQAFKVSAHLAVLLALDGAVVGLEVAVTGCAKARG
ncbi:hypothetical protein D3C76_1381290 [compost metagenome]